MGRLHAIHAVEISGVEKDENESLVCQAQCGLSSE